MASGHDAEDRENIEQHDGRVSSLTAKDFGLIEI
jgi:hypothetical protein